jgi:hypothetical protein
MEHSDFDGFNFLVLVLGSVLAGKGAAAAHSIQDTGTCHRPIGTRIKDLIDFHRRTCTNWPYFARHMRPSFLTTQASLPTPTVA